MALVTDIEFPALAKDLSNSLLDLHNNTDLNHVEGDIVLAGCHIRTLKNAEQQVNHLAAEVLAQIFLYLDALQLMEDASDILNASVEKTKTLYAAAHACRQWRHVVFSTPNLWNHIHIRHPSDPVAVRSLILSGNLPLTLYLVGYHGNDAFKPVKEHFHRLEHLHICSDDLEELDDNPLLSTTQWDTPLLKRIEIIEYKYYRHDFLPVIGLSSMRSLERVKLSTYALPQGLQIANLRSLVLLNQNADDQNSPGPHKGFNEFLPVLASSPLLEELALTLSGTQYGRFSDSPEFAQNPVHLPHLQSLALRCTGTFADDATLFFLACIRIFDTASRYVSVNTMDFEWSISLDRLLSIGRLDFASTPRTIRKLRLVTPGRAVNGGRGHCFMLTPDTVTYTSNIGFTDLLETSALGSVEEFSLITHEHHPSIEDLQVLFNALPALRRISVSEDMRDPAMVHRLGHVLGMNTDGISCPLLEGIEVLHYPASGDPDDFPKSEDDALAADGSMVALLCEERMTKGYPIGKVTIERCREEHVGWLKETVKEVLSTKRWKGYPGGYHEQSVLGEMTERTRNLT
ncbi:hypothetical protein D9611_012118 [Ephemerocybe angulata]|uniref:F-box domain-containing protein n=1 Tax=Ephemerocybe angulata TaxID=980116 RepID=A0A8H5C5Q2_9AGAR|nr:hypothetical protein D9611_012118 [Tulosesus angulatus]